jgi:hypothetical protein
MARPANLPACNAATLPNYWHAWCLYRSGDYQGGMRAMVQSLGALDHEYAAAARTDLGAMVAFRSDVAWPIESLATWRSLDPLATDAAIASYLMLGKLNAGQALEARLLDFEQTLQVRTPPRCERRGRAIHSYAPVDTATLLASPRVDGYCFQTYNAECLAALQSAATLHLRSGEFLRLCHLTVVDSSRFEEPLLLLGNYLQWNDYIEHRSNWRVVVDRALTVVQTDPTALATLDAALRNYVLTLDCETTSDIEHVDTLVTGYQMYLDKRHLPAPAHLQRLHTIKAANCTAIQGELAAAVVAPPH